MKRLLSVFILLNCYCICYSQTITALTIFNQSLVPDTVPGPIYNLTITIKDNSKGLLRWRTTSIPGESFFTIERSNNGTDFNVVGIIKNTASGSFEFLDDAASKGKIFYRIKLTMLSAITYSEIISATLSADLSCKFYPNPVDKVLIVRSESAVELQITDKFGKPLISDHLQPGLKVVDVSSLEPGIYVITLFQKETNRLITEKLVKK
jgi:Secretion system C-terminal sorting domain